MKLLLTTLLLITGISMAQQPPPIPHRISFQAMITDTLGNPVTDGTHNFTFRIDRPTQGGQVQTIWEETKQVAVVDGLISTILGSVNPIGIIPFSNNYFLRVALDNEVISVSPLTSVPFAFNASRAMGANNATHADTANFTHHAMHADTAHFVMNAPMSDTSHFAHQAGHAHHADSSGFAHHTEHAEHADTANIVMNAPIADTANFAHHAQHSAHSDTANYINLSNYIGSPNTEVFNGSIPSTWTDLDLSNVVGQKKAMVLLRVDLTNWQDDEQNMLIVRPDGDTNDYYYTSSGGSSSAVQSSLNVLNLTAQSGTIMVTTNNDGVIEIISPNSNYNGTISINIIFFIHS